MGHLFGGSKPAAPPPPPPVPPAAIPPTMASPGVQTAGGNQRARAAAGAGSGGFDSTLVGSPGGDLSAPNTAKASLLGNTSNP